MAGALGGISSALFGDGGADSYQQGLENLKKIDLPTLQKINPLLYKQVVSMNPALMEAASAGPSAMGGISLDPKLQQAQMAALTQLQDISKAGGNDAQFQAGMNSAVNDANSQAQGQIGALRQNMAARGMSGSMAEAMQSQMAAQSASNQAANTGVNIQAQAQMRALQALQNSGSLAQSMSSNSFNQQAQQAQAKDAINKFNASNLQNANAANAQSKNQAQQWNATTAQSTADQNTGLANNANQWNTNGMAQQNYANAAGKAQGMATQSNAIGKGKDAEKNSDMQLTGGMISALAMA